MEIYLVCFVAEKVDLFETLLTYVLEAVCLVPSIGENIERDLTTNGEGQPII